MSDPRTSDARGGQYLRVSVDRSGRARSNDEQRRENERDAEQQFGITIPTAATFSDPDRSASRYATKAREEYTRLVSAIRRGEIDILWLWESSRGSRRVGEWVSLLELCEDRRVRIRVTTHGRTYDPANPRDRRSLLEDAIDAEYESGKTSIRIRRGTAASAHAGRPHGKVPYGYMREYDLRTGRLQRQAPDPNTAPIVEEVVRRLAAGDPVLAIADDLTRRGVPTPTQCRAARSGLVVPDAAWTPGTIKHLFRSPTLMGLRVHNGQIAGSADWDRIVSPSDFEAVQRILGSRLVSTNPGGAPKYLLSGIATCGVCGARCDRQMNHGVPSYTCAGLPPARGLPRPPRKHVSRSLERVDALVTAQIVARMSRLDARELLATDRRDERAAGAARELADLQATLRVHEESMRSAATPAAAHVFQRHVNELAVQIARLEPLTVPQAVPEFVLELAGPDAAVRWDAMPLVRRRQVVRVLLEAVVIHRAPQSRGSHVFDESSVERRWRYA